MCREWGDNLLEHCGGGASRVKSGQDSVDGLSSGGLDERELCFDFEVESAVERREGRGGLDEVAELR